jgi:hypothetical protein
MFPLGVTFPIPALVVIPFLSLSTEQPPAGPVPHNTPSRILPTVPVTPVVTPGAPIVDEDWFALCTVIGSCKDLGSPCPPQVQNPPAIALWCDAPTLRGQCGGWALWTDCQQIDRNDGCGSQMSGVCAYDGYGGFLRIDPDSIKATGAFCPGTTCSWN